MRRFVALLLVAAFAFSFVPDASAKTKRAKKAPAAKSAKSAKKAKGTKKKKFLFFNKKTAMGWPTQTTV